LPVRAIRANAETDPPAADYQAFSFMILLIFSSVCFSTRIIFLAWAFLIFYVNVSRSAGFSTKSVAPSFMASMPFSSVPKPVSRIT